MKPRYEIVLENGSGGRLDDRRAYNRAEVKAAVMSIARSVTEYYGGDTIRVIDRTPDEEEE